jgi:hypothetical protein
MSDAIKIAMIVSIAPTILAVVQLILSLKNSKKLDGVLADRVRAATDVGRAEGKAEGKEAGHAEGVADQKATQGVTRRTGD